MQIKYHVLSWRHQCLFESQGSRDQCLRGCFKTLIIAVFPHPIVPQTDSTSKSVISLQRRQAHSSCLEPWLFCWFPEPKAPWGCLLATAGPLAPLDHCSSSLIYVNTVDVGLFVRQCSEGWTDFHQIWMPTCGLFCLKMYALRQTWISFWKTRWNTSKTD